MKRIQLELSDLKENTANPREIKDNKFAKLVNSILVFPEMLDARPMVVNTEKTILGGNMRFKALSYIATLDENEIYQRLQNVNDYTIKTQDEKKKLIEFWSVFLDKPIISVEIVDWSAQQQKEFIIKDNASFGEWDWDALANEWDEVSLEDWGVDVWKMTEGSDIDVDSFLNDIPENSAKEETQDIKLCFSADTDISDAKAKIKEALSGFAYTIK